MLEVKCVFECSECNHLRVLEQKDCGSFICVQRKNKFDEVFIFNYVENKTTLLHVHKEAHEHIINGTINNRKTLLSFTTVTTNECITNEPITLTRTTSDNAFSPKPWKNCGYTLKQENGVVQAVENQDLEYGQNSKTRLSHLGQLRKCRGKYNSYLVGINCKWVMKFRVERKLLQKVKFLDQELIKGHQTDEIYEDRLLFVMDRGSVGLYSILSKYDTINNQSTLVNSPKSTILKHKIIWCQFDELLQQIFYISCSHKNIHTANGNTERLYVTKLHCEQFCNRQLHELLYSVKIDLGIPNKLLTEKIYDYTLEDISPVTSQDCFNIRVLVLENGRMILCWQILSEEIWKQAHVVVLSSDVQLTLKPNLDLENGNMVKAKFINLQNNLLLVHLPGIFSTILNIQTLSGQNLDIQPLHGTFLNSKFISLPNSFEVLPYQFQMESYESFPPRVILDCESRDVYAIAITKTTITDTYINASIGATTKSFLVRTANEISKASLGNSQPMLSTILLNFDEDDMILHGDEIIANCLLYMAAFDTVKTAQEVKGLEYLLPTHCGNACIADEESVSLEMHQKSLRSEIRRQLSDRSSGVKARFDGYICDIQDSFKSGAFSMYNGNIINEELKVLKGNNKDIISRLKMQLAKTFTDNIFLDKAVPHAIKCQENRNLVTLTFQRVVDHLKQHLDHQQNWSAIARSYILSQISAVDHLLALFELVTNFNRNFNLFTILDEDEEYFLNLLNQLQGACSLINFPCPLDTKSNITCLTFRSLISKYGLDFESPETTVDSSCALDEFKADFLNLIDSGYIAPTCEFIAKFSNELPNISAYNDLRKEILARDLRNLQMDSGDIFDITQVRLLRF